MALTSSRYRPASKFIVTHPLLLCALLSFALAAVYGPFLSNPLVFDDKTLLATRAALEAWLTPSVLDLRWLPYASLAWTRELVGEQLFGFRLGNLMLHAANAALLFLFLRRVTRLVFETTDAGSPSGYYTWLAFFCGLIFALHPVAVYAAAYLIQRSILLATLFSLLMWMAYLEGIARNKQGWLLVSALFYYLAVFSKELSIMAPAVALCLTLLLHRPSLALLKKIAPAFLLYTAIAIVVMFKARHTILAAYEPKAAGMLAGVDPALILPLSVINQSFLFFKYLLLWIIPHAGWMSVDMREAFPHSVLSFPQVLGPVLFALYAALGAWLLLGRDSNTARLAGFALLAPALMFVTEFATVRVQEPFVLYRSYLWFGGFFAIVPALACRFDAKEVLAALAVVSVALVPLTWNRLTTFSDLLLLWDDAAALVGTEPVSGADRIYYNRGNAFLARKQMREALDDYATVLRLNPAHAGAYNNRGSIHYAMGRYAEAVRDFEQAVAHEPRSRRPYFGLGMSYLALGKKDLAEENLRRSCDMGFQPACLQVQALRRRGAASAPR